MEQFLDRVHQRRGGRRNHPPPPPAPVAGLEILSKNNVDSDEEEGMPKKQKTALATDKNAITAKTPTRKVNAGKGANLKRAKAAKFFAPEEEGSEGSEDDMEDEDIESRQGASNRALDALLERATNRRHRGVKSSAQRAREELAKRKATEDVSRRAQKMLASQIKAHNDEVLAEASLDVFEVERRRQTDASEALVSDLMDEEITRYNELMAKGATPQRRIENRLKHLKRRKR